MVVGKLSEQWSNASPVTISQENGKIFYEVEFKEREHRTSPEDVMVSIYKYIHDIAETHSADVDQCQCVVTVPLEYNEEERGVVKRCASKAGRPLFDRQ